MSTTTVTRERRRSWRKEAVVAATLALGLVALTQGLSAMDSPLPVPAGGPELGLQLPAAHPPAGLAFSVLPTSSSRGAAEALVVGGGSWLRYRRPAHVAVLVQHPQATFLFDTGLGRQVDAQFQANRFFERQLFAYGEVHPVVDQLAAAGWAPSRIRMVIPSHMHWDHISGLPDFPDAEVWTQPQEREAAAHGHAPAFLASQFAGVRHWRELRFTDGPYVGFERSLDWFKDGSVVFVPLGGHTAGQVGLFLTLPSGQRYFFTGDTTWTMEGLRIPADRSWALRQMVQVDHDVAANQAAIVQVHRILTRFPQLKVVPAHDEHVLATLPRFPAFAH